MFDKGIAISEIKMQEIKDLYGVFCRMDAVKHAKKRHLNRKNACGNIQNVLEINMNQNIN